ncbi:hypothetical protein [Pseudoruegeria sp. SK021]|uniref:hypothetical protein n=1 Tax=Pseudoruegeria sp. SK021 TaxID=1933035 RepID=UPI000A22925C|nr:hypothetical protein [Pseudoruegeria sp. SK021]OSP55715.1 hypothetical protein BV911_06300 [Pseudoruegeria sp. SK021]
MDRTDIIFATAILLFVAFSVGFLTNWIISRVSHVSKDDLGELDRMAEALHHAEEARDAAIARQEDVEGRLRRRLAQSDAELKAAMEGLRDARANADELRAFISSANMGNGHR